MDFGALTGAITGDVINAGVGLYEQRRNEAFQQEMAKNGIRWRVEDANAAGVSPLFALGASGASGSSPSFIAGDMGQDISRAAMAGASPEEQNAAVLRNKLVESQINETDLRSEGIRLQNTKLMQDLLPSSGIPSLFGGNGAGRGLVVTEGQQFGAGLRGAVTPEAVKIPSASTGSRAVTAGQSPGWSDYRMTDGTVVSLPYAGEGQTFMAQSPVSGMVLALPQWLWKNSFGKSPMRVDRQPIGKSIRQSLSDWWSDKSVYDPNSSYWRSR